MKPRRTKSKPVRGSCNSSPQWSRRAKTVIESIAAVLTPLCWNAGSLQTRPRRVVFTVRERLDSDVMHTAFARLKNSGLLRPVMAMCNTPLHSPEFARFRARDGMIVEFVGTVEGAGLMVEGKTSQSALHQPSTKDHQPISPRP